LPEIPTTVNVK